MSLSPTQAAILAAAAQHPERLAAPPPKLAPAPRDAIRKSLLAKGLIEAAPLPAADEATAWPADGAPVTYRMTAAGLAAIRAEARSEAGMPPKAPTESAEAGPPSTGTLTLAETRPEPQAGPPESTSAVPTAQPPRALLAAAEAVLVAWDAIPDHAGLDEAVAALRTALAGTSARGPRAPGAPRKPREGTKQQQVLSLSCAGRKARRSRRSPRRPAGRPTPSGASSPG